MSNNGVGGVDATCTGKVSYATRAEAQRIFDCMTKRVAKRMRFMSVYKCGFCHLYHIGNDSGLRYRRKRA